MQLQVAQAQSRSHPRVSAQVVELTQRVLLHGNGQQYFFGFETKRVSGQMRESLSQQTMSLSTPLPEAATGSSS